MLATVHGLKTSGRDTQYNQSIPSLTTQTTQKVTAVGFRLLLSSIVYLAGSIIFLKRAVFNWTIDDQPLLFGRPAHSALCSAKFFREKAPAQWAEAIIQTHNIQVGQDNSDKTIAMDLPLERVAYYSALQKRMAHIIPIEAHRPTVDLQLLGRNIRPDAASTGAILGGVGPLSDAELVNSVMRNLKRGKLQLSNIKISLYSSPPPRKIFDLAMNFPRYLTCLFEFMNRKHSQIYIASNTLHTHFEVINALGTGNTVNLVQHVADTIQKTSRKKRENILVIGTTQAHRAELYPRLLKERGLAYTNTTLDEQCIVQEEIDKVKMGQLRDKGKRLHRLITARIAKSRHEGFPITTVLFGCTEVPMALSGKMHQIERESRGKIVNTEAVFAAKIAKDIKQNSGMVFRLSK